MLINVLLEKGVSYPPGKLKMSVYCSFKLQITIIKTINIFMKI